VTQRNILVADPQHSRGADMQGKPRTVVNVAVGILMRADGHYLLTTRPSDKDYGGYWEFPGGKLEIGETVEQALRRELQEEIGITIGQAYNLRVDMVDYPHALVRLHFCKVLDWAGELTMREGQDFVWTQLPCQASPILPGTLPVLAWLENVPADHNDAA
jgi:8-oxo-dGTP diphosphatase